VTHKSPGTVNAKVFLLCDLLVFLMLSCEAVPPSWIPPARSDTISLVFVTDRSCFLHSENGATAVLKLKLRRVLIPCFAFRLSIEELD